MPSSFPGMNPYLEQSDAWHDFRERLVPRISDAIATHLGENYIIKIDEHVYIHELPAGERRFLGRPDVFLSQLSSREQHAGGPALLEAPEEGVLPDIDEESQSFIEIRDKNSRDLVTVIEVLIPSNKDPRKDRDLCIGKRKVLLKSHVHFVEIDLLRGRGRLPPDGAIASDYRILVSRYTARPKVGLWPFSLRDSIPPIPIPLQAPDEDVILELQPVLHELYDATPYYRYIYDGQPEPPLSPKDQAWADEILSENKITT